MSKPTVIVPPPPDFTARLADLEARFAGADQARAAAVLERDAARRALDILNREPCRVCGTQRADSP